MQQRRLLISRLKNGTQKNERRVLLEMLYSFIFSNITNYDPAKLLNLAGLIDN